MPRPTKAEVELEILDRAAALFARHGFADTSLQQIANVTGYTKAGLLHHFPSKEALYRAALHTTHEQVVVLVAGVEEVPSGRARDVVLIERVVDATLSLPGLSALATSLLGSDRLEEPDFVETGMALLGALGVDPTAPDDERLVRIIITFAGLTAACLAAVRLDLAHDWRTHIVTAAADSLSADSLSRHGGTGAKDRT